MWTNLFDLGKAYDLKPIGLGARIFSRLEMKYCLYGHDIDETTSPLEAGLGWIVKSNKISFLSKDFLIEQKALGLKRKSCCSGDEGEGDTKTAL